MIVSPSAIPFLTLIQCNIVVSGDAKTEQIIYNIDSRTFDHEGEADLSVVHIHCPDGPANVDGLSDEHIPSDSGDQQIQTSTSEEARYVDANDYLAWNETAARYESWYKRPEAPSPNDTDFENELNVIFQISDQPRYFANQEDAKEHKSRLNMDFLWSAIRDRTMTQEEVEYEQYQAGGADRAYRRTWGQANNSGAAS